MLNSLEHGQQSKTCSADSNMLHIVHVPLYVILICGKCYCAGVVTARQGLD